MSADFWAGYLSGAVGIIVGNPLDLIKTRLQAGPAAESPSPSQSQSESLRSPVSRGGRGGAAERIRVRPTAVAAATAAWRGTFGDAGTLVRGMCVFGTASLLVEIWGICLAALWNPYKGIAID